MSAQDEITALDQLDVLAKSVEAKSDHQLREYVQQPEFRATVLNIREKIQPWLQAFNRLANADRRLAKALNKTAGRRRV